MPITPEETWAEIEKKRAYWREQVRLSAEEGTQREVVWEAAKNIIPEGNIGPEELESMAASPYRSPDPTLRAAMPTPVASDWASPLYQQTIASFMRYGYTRQELYDILSSSGPSVGSEPRAVEQYLTGYMERQYGAMPPQIEYEPGKFREAITPWQWAQTGEFGRSMRREAYVGPQYEDLYRTPGWEKAARIAGEPVFTRQGEHSFLPARQLIEAGIGLPGPEGSMMVPEALADKLAKRWRQWGVYEQMTARDPYGEPMMTQAPMRMGPGSAVPEAGIRANVAIPLEQINPEGGSVARPGWIGEFTIRHPVDVPIPRGFQPEEIAQPGSLIYMAGGGHFVPFKGANPQQIGGSWESAQILDVVRTPSLTQKETDVLRFVMEMGIEPAGAQAVLKTAGFKSTLAFASSPEAFERFAGGPGVDIVASFKEPLAHAWSILQAREPDWLAQQLGISVEELSGKTWQDVAGPLLETFREKVLPEITTQRQYTIQAHESWYEDLPDEDKEIFTSVTPVKDYNLPDTMLPKEGMVRLYRGMAEAEAIPLNTLPGWMRQQQNMRGVEEARGRWFTQDPVLAERYVQEAAAGGQYQGVLAYVDVPEKVAQASLAANMPEDIRSFSQDPGSEYFLPRKWAKKARLGRMGLAPETGQLELTTRPIQTLESPMLFGIGRHYPWTDVDLHYREMQRMERAAPGTFQAMERASERVRRPLGQLIASQYASEGEGEMPTGTVGVTPSQAQAVIMAGQEWAMKTAGVENIADVPREIMERGLLLQARMTWGSSPIEVAEGQYMTSFRAQQQFYTSGALKYSETSRLGRASVSWLRAMAAREDDPEAYQQAVERVMGVQQEIAHGEALRNFLGGSFGGRAVGRMIQAGRTLAPEEVYLRPEDVMKTYGVRPEHEEMFMEQWRAGQIQPLVGISAYPTIGDEPFRLGFKAVLPETLRERGELLSEQTPMLLSESYTQAMQRDFDADDAYAFMRGSYKVMPGGRIQLFTHKGVKIAEPEDIERLEQRAREYGARPLSAEFGSGPGSVAALKEQLDPSKFVEVSQQGVVERTRAHLALQEKIGPLFNRVEQAALRAREGGGTEEQIAFGEKMFGMTYGTAQRPEELPGPLRNLMDVIQTGSAWTGGFFSSGKKGPGWTGFRGAEGMGPGLLQAALGMAGKQFSPRELAAGLTPFGASEETVSEMAGLIARRQGLEEQGMVLEAHAPSSSLNLRMLQLSGMSTLEGTMQTDVGAMAMPFLTERWQKLVNMSEEQVRADWERRLKEHPEQVQGTVEDQVARWQSARASWESLQKNRPELAEEMLEGMQTMQSYRGMLSKYQPFRERVAGAIATEPELMERHGIRPRAQPAATAQPSTAPAPVSTTGVSTPSNIPPAAAVMDEKQARMLASLNPEGKPATDLEIEYSRVSEKTARDQAEIDKLNEEYDRLVSSSSGISDEDARRLQPEISDRTLAHNRLVQEKSRLKAAVALQRQAEKAPPVAAESGPATGGAVPPVAAAIPEEEPIEPHPAMGIPVETSTTTSSQASAPRRAGPSPSSIAYLQMQVNPEGKTLQQLQAEYRDISSQLPEITSQRRELERQSLNAPMSEQAALREPMDRARVAEERLKNQQSRIQQAIQLTQWREASAAAPPGGTPPPPPPDLGLGGEAFSGEPPEGTPGQPAPTPSGPSQAGLTPENIEAFQQTMFSSITGAAEVMGRELKGTIGQALGSLRRTYTRQEFDEATQGVVQGLREFNETIRPMIESGKKLNRAQLGAASHLEDYLETMRKAQAQGGWDEEDPTQAAARQLLGMNAGPLRDELYGVSQMVGPLMAQNRIQSMMQGMGGGIDGGIWTEASGMGGGQGSLGRGLQNMLGGQYGLLSGFGMMRLARMWNLTGGPAFQAIPVAAQAEQAAVQAALGVGSLDEMQMGGTTMHLMQYQAQQQNRQINMGEATAGAYGWTQQAFPGLATAEGILRPALGAGAVAGTLGMMAGMTLPAAAGIIAAPVAVGMAGIGATAWGANAVSDRERMAMALGGGGIEGWLAEQRRWVESRSEAWQTFNLGRDQTFFGIDIGAKEEYAESLEDLNARLKRGELGEMTFAERVASIEGAAKAATQKGGNLAFLSQTQAAQLIGKYTQAGWSTNAPEIAGSPEAALLGQLGLEPESFNQLAIPWGAGVTGGEALLQSYLQAGGTQERKVWSRNMELFQPLARFGMTYQQAAAMPEIKSAQDQHYISALGRGELWAWSLEGMRTGQQNLITQDPWTGMQIGANWGGGILANQWAGQLGQIGNQVQFAGGNVMLGGQQVAFNQWGLQDFATQAQRGYQDWQYGFQQQGMALQYQNQMAQWGVQDQMTALSRAYQQQQFGFQAQDMARGDRQFRERWNFQWQRAGIEEAWQGADMSRAFGRQMTQFNWQEQDLAFQGQRAALSFGWQMEDFDEAERFATGRDRRRIQRQRERAVTSFGMQMGQLETEEGRLDERRKWAEEDYNREKEHFEQRKSWRQEELQMQLRHHDQDLQMQRQRLEASQQYFRESNKLQDEQRDLTRDYWKENFERQKEALEKEREYALLQRQIQDAQTALGRAQEQQVRRFTAEFQMGSLLNRTYKNMIDGWVNYMQQKTTQQYATGAIR